MNRFFFAAKAILAAALLAAMTSCAIAPIWQQDDSWGEPVDGVQLHVAVSSSGPPAIPGELPTFEVQIRNRGSRSITFDAGALIHPSIEVDGIWYAQPYATFGSGVVVVARCSQSNVYRVHYSVFVMYELDNSLGRAFKLLPGPHRIRVRVHKERDAIHAYPVDAKLKQFISNYVTIDTPVLSLAAERAVLIEQTEPSITIDRLPSSKPCGRSGEWKP